MDNFIIKKRGKYLTGHSYASPAHIGYRHYWSPDINKARVMDEEIASLVNMHAKGEIERK